MHFIISLIAPCLVAAASVQVLPSSPVEQRQDTPRIYAKFYNDTACLDTWVEDTVWLENPPQTCIENTITATYGSTLIADNLATHTLRVFSLPGCNPNQGNYYDVPAGVEKCYAGQARSVEFL
ncbi:uncharacterized protein BCR38DRAFT_406969 [Pseudomassariella vexata]|uniref:Uncharacterized protein n=1 Tax=Pseudomassariella vexata TaxID=1141098 RepID=A0A1Y2EBZ8_9PEZI|nr:uncharacterized protein BCR38DRAFT_406969 [Pseudomassariella vexata]ORY69103.1 hypothetical protein BCR38DRAFT_406969 [Pseudomassariella vexata]